jgi:MATE family multidrug resistance protein
MAITTCFKKVFEETVEINKLAMPSITINVLEASMILTDVIVLGYLGKGNLAAASIGMSYFNISWFFIEGVLTAQDTLSAQAFGMNDVFDLRCWLYVSIIVTIFLCSISTVLLAFGYLVISYVFQINQHVGSKAALHVILLIPNLWFLSGFRVLQKYLLAQKISKPSIYCSLLGIVVKLLLNYFLIFLFGLGFAGVGLSTSIARLCMLISLCRYLRKSEDYEK